MLSSTARQGAPGLSIFGPFNLGEPGDFRVPDGGPGQASIDEVYAPTTVVVIEVLSPGDETYAKFSFYHGHNGE